MLFPFLAGEKLTMVFDASDVSNVLICVAYDIVSVDVNLRRVFIHLSHRF